MNNNWENWFEENPEKILGEVKILQSSIRGSQNKFDYETVIGDIEKFNSVASTMPDYMQISASNPIVGNLNIDINETTATPEEITNLQRSNNETKQDLEKLEKRVASVNNEGTWTYEEVDETYNKGISVREKQAYALYLHRLKGSALEGGFAKYDMQDNVQNLKMLVREGYMCFDNTEAKSVRQYKPTFYYASGNIRKKLKKLEEDKDFYVSNFGEEAYSNHYDVLVNALVEVKEKRLDLVNEDKSKRISLHIRSKFVDSIKVSPIIPLDKDKSVMSYSSYMTERKDEDGNKKLLWRIHDGDSASRGGYYIDGWHRVSRGEPSLSDRKIPLKEAFSFWLRELNDYNEDFKKYGVLIERGVSLQEVQDYYINRNKRPPSGQPYRDEEGNLTNEWRLKAKKIKKTGEYLFELFLEKGLTKKDQENISFVWNSEYNGMVNFDYNKVPILFRFVKYDGLDEMDIRPEKRRAIGFNMLTGSSLLAYGVGMGKTFCSIFTMAQNMDLGLCKRPLVIVPNSVYPQFFQEIKKLLPQYKVNGLYNLRGDLTQQAKEIEDNTISIIAESGLKMLGFQNEETGQFIKQRITDILDQGALVNKKKTERQRQKDSEKKDEFLGDVQAMSTVAFDGEGSNWDYLVVDEAHNYKNLIEGVKGEVNQTGTAREKSEYRLTGKQSGRAVKMFALTQYIQSKSNNGNCLLLTATPFTNTPLEIYAMLAMINYDFIKEHNFGSIKEFFDFYALMGEQIQKDAKLELVARDVVIGFRNVVSLQGIIYSLIDKPTKEEEEKKVRRPNKIVLPIFAKKVGDSVIDVSEKNQVTTLLRMTSEQKENWGTLRSYADGDLNYEILSSESNYNTTKCSTIEQMKKQAKKKADDDKVSKADYNSRGIRSILSVSYGKAISLSPYLYRFSGYKENPTPAEFVQSAPKIEYSIECIRTVKEHHEKTKTPMSGQVIYITRGVSCFDLILQYLVDDLGFKWHEVGYIATDNDSKIGKKSVDKDDVQDAFLGRKLDKSDPKNPKYVSIPDEQRVKVIIGTSSIKEGVNLQFYSTCLYVCEIDWNPTDMTQLEGRIWRQKNAFANVRIVIPLLENSMDGFVYSRIQEKIGRLNELWEQDGKNEFDLDELDPQELNDAISRNPYSIAKTLTEKEIEKESIKEADITNNYAILQEARKVDSYLDKSKNTLVEPYGRRYNFEKGSIYRYKDRNITDYLYSFVKLIRPDLVPLPLVKNMDELFNFTETQEKRNAKFNDNQLNYSLETLLDLINVVRKDKLIKYPKGYLKDWQEIIASKKKPFFLVGEKVKFETKRGFKEGKIVEVVNPNEYRSDFMLYDVDLGDDIIIENVNTLTNKMSSLDNPIIEKPKVDLGLQELKLGLKDSEKELDDLFAFYLNGLNSNEFIVDFNDNDPSSENYIGYDSFAKYGNIRRELETLKTFPKFYDFLMDEYLIKAGYSMNLQFLKNDKDNYWNKYLIPQGINSEDKLTIALAESKEELDKVNNRINYLNSAESSLEYLKEAEKILEERESEGDTPLSPIECARIFATPNPDYLGNGYLDVFDAEYLEAKEETIYDKKAKLLKVMLMTAKGKKKKLIETKLHLLTVMSKKK